MLRELPSDDPRQHAADDVQMMVVASASVGQQRRDSPTNDMTNDDYLALGVVVPRCSALSVPL